MSRLTGSDAKGLMEAYQAVYAPRELTEEQVWEGVENWVNSLLEEGYDLSDYTWDEMYEAYSQLDEYAAMAAPLIQAGIRAALPAIGAATKFLQGRGQSKPQEPVDYGQMSPGSFAASKETRSERRARIDAKNAERKKNAERNRAVGGERTTRQPSPAQPASGNPPSHNARIGRQYPAPKPEAVKPPETTPGQSSTSSSTSTPSGGGGSATGGSGGRKPKPEGPNPAQQFLGSKWKEFRQSVGRGGKDSQGRGVTAAGGELAGSLVRTPIRQTLDVANKVVTPLIAPVGLSAVGGGAAWKGLTDLMNPKTPAGRWIRGVREEYEIGDILINHLIEEKYAKDEKSALSIIENMSEKWAVSILENYFES